MVLGTHVLMEVLFCLLAKTERPFFSRSDVIIALNLAVTTCGTDIDNSDWGKPANLVDQLLMQ